MNEVILDEKKEISKPKPLKKELIRKTGNALLSYLQNYDCFDEINELLKNNERIKLIKIWLDLAQNGNEETMKEMIKSGMDIDVCEENDWTALHVAAINSQTSTIQLLLSSGAKVDSQNNEGRTALMDACVYGPIEIVQLLINFGSNVNIQDKNGRPPLIGAAANNNLSVIQLLIDHGAIVNLQGITGRSALSNAANYNYDASINLLLKNGGGNVDLQTKDGMTSLMIASEENNVLAIKALLENDADVEIKNNKNQTAYDLAKNDKIRDFIKNYNSSKFILK